MSSAEAIIITDTATDGDHRVLSSIEEHSPSCRLLDIRDFTKPKASDFIVIPLESAFSLLQLLLIRPGALAALIRLLKGSVHHHPFAGMKAFFLWRLRSRSAARSISDNPEYSSCKVVHAHDLYCGATAAECIASTPGAHLIYDAHEFEIHRNRKAGWLRILLDFSLERRVLLRADEVRVVNRRIGNIMRDLYDIEESRIRVVSHLYFEDYPTSRPTADSNPTIVYVGKGFKGRNLEFLDKPPEILGFSVVMFTLGTELPRSVSGRHWEFGPKDYSGPLGELASSRRCLMWCCIESKALSYRLATPNKFFQALAAGIPPVASSRTYLAEIIEQYDLGPIFDGSNLESIRALCLSEKFPVWQDNCTELRNRLRSGEIVL